MIPGNLRAHQSMGRLVGLSVVELWLNVLAYLSSPSQIILVV